MQSQDSFHSQENLTPVRELYPLRNQLQGFNFQKEVKREDPLTEAKMSFYHFINEDHSNLSQMEMMKRTINSSEFNFPEKTDKKTTFFDNAVCIGGNPCFEICCYKNCNKSAITCNKMECICRIEHEKQFPDPDEMCTRIDPRFLLKKIQTSCNREEYIQREFSKMRHIVSKSFLEFVLAVKKIQDTVLKSLNILEQKVRSQKKCEYFSEPEPTPEEKWFLEIAQNSQRSKDVYSRNLQQMTGKKISEVKASITRKKQQSENLLSAMCDKLSNKLNEKLPALYEKLKQMGTDIEEMGNTKPFESQRLRSIQSETSKSFENEPSQSFESGPSQFFESYYQRNTRSKSIKNSNTRYYYQEPRRVSTQFCKKLPRTDTKIIPGLVHKLFSANPLNQIAKESSFADKNYSKIIKTNNEAETLFEFFQDVEIDFNINSYKKFQSSGEHKEQPMLQLLYRATDMDFSIHMFHKLCDNKPNTIIFIKTKGGQKIGGFTPCLWNIAEKYKNEMKKQNKQCDPSGQTFIFSVTTQSKFKMTDGSQAIDSRVTGFGFCGRPDCQAFDLYIYKDYGKSTKGYALYANNFQHKSYKKFDPQSYQRFHGEREHKFLIKQWEVYQIKVPVQK